MPNCKFILSLFVFSAALSAAPLHQAVKDINEPKVYKLVQAGADVNGVDRNGKTPLHLAAPIGRLSLVKYLVEHGADIHLKDSAHKTPLVYAIEKNHIKVIMYLSKEAARYKPSEKADIFTAAKRGDTEQVMLFLESAEINGVNKDGKTVLHIACEYAREDIVKLLLLRNIDKNIRDYDGRDALNYAKLSGNKKIIELLQDKDATE